MRARFLIKYFFLIHLIFLLEGCSKVTERIPLSNSVPPTQANETVQASTGPTLPPITSVTKPTPTPTVAPAPTNTYNLSGSNYSTSVSTCNDQQVNIAFVPNMTNIVIGGTGWHGTFIISNGIVVFTPEAGYGGNAGLDYNGTVNGQASHVEVQIVVGFCTINPPPQTTTTPSGGTVPVVSVVTITPQFITTPNNLKIPNFCDTVVASGTTTVTAIANGNWSNVSTWSNNQIPSAGQRVKISGNTVIYDLPTPAVTTPTTYNPALQTLCIESGGVLRFRTDMNTQLLVQNLVDLPGGTLEMGSAANPVASNFKAELIFADQPLDTNTDPEQFGNGLIALGKVTMQGATLSDTFVRLDVEPLAGDTTLTLSKPVTGWKNGDRLLLPDSRQLAQGSTYVSQVERPTLTSVSSNGLVLTLSAPLQFRHPGVHTTSSNTSSIDSLHGIKFLPHIGNMTRNVLIRSRSATQIARGYILFTERAEVNIQYVQFSGLGRTKNPSFAAPDNTKFSIAGNVSHIGTNQDGRYAIYFNHLYGPATVGGSPQYTFMGNSVFCPLDPMPFKWGITINDSHFGLIKDNVLFNWAGAGMMAESGNETQNVIAHNFVVHSPGDGAREDNYSIRWGMAGSGYFFRGPLNYFRDNVASGAPSGVYSYGFVFNFDSVGNSRVPNSAGKTTTLLGDYTTQNMNAQAVVEFAGNEAYGAISSGFTYWWWNATYNTPHNNNGGSTIKDLRVWNIYTYGVFPYQSNKVTLDGLVIRGDLAMTANGGARPGIIPVDYYGKDIKVINADIRNMSLGIGFSSLSDGILSVENSYFQNLVDIDARNGELSGGFGLSVKPRTIILRNNKFVALAGRPHTAIARLSYDHDMTNHIVSDRLFSYDHNQIPGNNLQIYFAEQAADYPLPPDRLAPSGTSTWAIGCPAPAPNPATCYFGNPSSRIGCMTNQECFDATGQCKAGEITPPNHYTDPEIRGVVVDR